MRNLSLVTARLTALGFYDLLAQLSAGPITLPIVLPFSNLKAAKAVQRLLYNWLWFFPEVKERTSVSLDEQTGDLTIRPKRVGDGRGRRKLV